MYITQTSCLPSQQPPAIFCVPSREQAQNYPSPLSPVHAHSVTDPQPDSGVSAPARNEGSARDQRTSVQAQWLPPCVLPDPAFTATHGASVMTSAAANTWTLLAAEKSSVNRSIRLQCPPGIFKEPGAHVRQLTDRWSTRSDCFPCSTNKTRCC